MEDALKAERLFAKGGEEALDELLELATEFWDRHGPTGPDAAEVARLARVAAYLSLDPPMGWGWSPLMRGEVLALDSGTAWAVGPR